MASAFFVTRLWSHQRFRRMQPALSCWPLTATLLAWAAPAVFAQGSECPVRLLEIVNKSREDDGGTSLVEGLFLDEEGLAYLARQRSPLYLVPALGVYRGGKSLLMNRVMGLKAPYHGGFGVGHTRETYTRGIDICAEPVDGLGTVVWMDTEGLFSQEEARSAYGPKLFSLALLFSSSVLLNSVGVFSEQLFEFFSQQQQLARVLRQGLDSEGLPAEALLPANLSICWLLQRPSGEYDSSGKASRTTLDKFLTVPGDESRARVQRDFRHLVHEIPIIAHDARLWNKTEQLQDHELLPEYVAAGASLRRTLLTELKENARPLQAGSVAAHLRMFVELVETKRFSGALVREVFEDAEVGKLCEQYARNATELAGELPSASLEDALKQVATEVETQRLAVIEAFHLGGDWSRRLGRCLQDRAEDLRRQNSQLVLARWKATARAVAEEGGECFFLGALASRMDDFVDTYGEAFTRDDRDAAVDFASALQRTKLVECVRLRDFIWPLAPWLIGPIAGNYLSDRLIAGVISMVQHSLLGVIIYMGLQFFNKVPPYLDVDYPVLRANPFLLELTMRAPSIVPWAAAANIIGLLGAVFSAWWLIPCIIQLIRPAGRGYEVSQLRNLELKINCLLTRSKAMYKQGVVAAALDAAEHLDDGDARAATRSLLQGLCLLRDLTDQDPELSAIFEGSIVPGSQKYLRETKQLPRQPPPEAERQSFEHDLVGLVARGDWSELKNHMAQLLEMLGRQRTTKATSLDGSRQPDSQGPAPPAQRRGLFGRAFGRASATAPTTEGAATATAGISTTVEAATPASPATSLTASTPVRESRTASTDCSPSELPVGNLSEEDSGVDSDIIWSSPQPNPKLEATSSPKDLPDLASPAPLAKGDEVAQLVSHASEVAAGEEGTCDGDEYCDDDSLGAAFSHDPAGMLSQLTWALGICLGLGMALALLAAGVAAGIMPDEAPAPAPFSMGTIK